MVVITPLRRFGTHSYPGHTEGLMTTRLHIGNDYQYPVQIQKRCAGGWKLMGILGTSERLYHWAAEGEVWRLWDPQAKQTVAQLETFGDNAVLLAEKSALPLAEQHVYRY